jgi:hypothetical protein
MVLLIPVRIRVWQNLKLKSICESKNSAGAFVMLGISVMALNPDPDKDPDS